MTNPKPEPPNPFSISIPQLQIAWDSVSMGLFKECPRKYLYTLILGFGSGIGSIHPEFGIAYHSCLESFDRAKARGASHEEAQLLGMRQALSWDDSHFVNHEAYNLKNRFTLSRVFLWYTDQFKDDPAQTVILGDGNPAVELSFRLELTRKSPDGIPYLYCGHLDRLVEYNSDIYWMDRKTTKYQLDSRYFSSFTPNTQMTGYFFSSQTILPTPAKGGIVDAAQLLVNGAKFQRHIIHRSEEELEDWLKDTYIFLSLAEQFAERGHWPMNDKACDNFGGCGFRPICSKPASLRLALLKQTYEERHWNPLEVREG